MVSEARETISDVARAVQRQVETVCLEAMELQHEEPKPGTIARMRALLEEVKGRAAQTGAEPLVDGVRLVEQALALTDAGTAAPAPYLGHFVTATAADLARIVHALERGQDPDLILAHARETLRSMPRQGTDYMVEVDLADPAQVARVFAVVDDSQEPAKSGQRPGNTESPQAGRLRELRRLLAAYVTQVEQLRAHPERVEALDDLATGARALRASAAAGGMTGIDRLLARAIAVGEAQRQRDEPVSAEVVAFLLACARSIGEGLSTPGGATPQFQTLILSASRLLHGFHVDTRMLGTAALGEAAGTRSLFSALQVSHGVETPAREVGHERLARDFSVALTHLPGTLERLERDPRSVAARAALAQLIQLVRQTAAAAGLNPFVERCAALENSLDDAGSGPLPDALLSGFRELGRELQALVERGIPQPEEPAPRVTATVDAERLGELAGLVEELAVKSGGYGGRAQYFADRVQELALLGERLRALIDQPAQAQALAIELAEIAADAGILTGDLMRWGDREVELQARAARLVTRARQDIRELSIAPLTSLAPALERAVRGLGARLGKQVALRVEVDGVAVPSPNLRPLSEAVLHLLRNAVEHGIEPPQERIRLGKPETGQLRLRAVQNDQELVVELSDDGAGIDEARVVRQATESGYPIPETGLSRERALQLIFLPGLSTRAGSPRQATGRGLDLVGRSVAELRGRAQVTSALGQGTTIRLHLPRSFASVRATTVEVDGAVYALPYCQLEPLSGDPAPAVRAVPETGGFALTTSAGDLRVADFGALLGLRPPRAVLEPGGTLVSVRQDGERLALRVDRVIGAQTLELEPATQLEQRPGVVGCAELAGKRALVVDLAQLLTEDAAGPRRQVSPGEKLAVVADDSIATRRALCGALEDEGWAVVEARDGLEAWEQLERLTPSLLLIDLDLALLDAVQVIGAARARPGTRIVALLNVDDPLRQSLLQALGIDAVLCKPIDEPVLIDTVRLLEATAGYRRQ